MLTTRLIHHVHSLTFPSEAVGTCLPTCRLAEHYLCLRRALLRHCYIWDASAADLPSTVRVVRPEGAEMSEAYKLKTIDFLGRRVPIVVQNANGPCPMLALANVLLLRNQIQLSPDAPEVTQVCQPAHSAIRTSFRIMQHSDGLHLSCSVVLPGADPGLE